MSQKYKVKNNTKPLQTDFKKAELIRDLLNEKSIKQQKLDYILFKEIENGHWDGARKLIVKGANINVTDLENNTILLKAIEKNIEFAKFLLNQKNIDVNIKTLFSGKTPLIAAIEKGRDDIVSKLIEKGADVNVQDSDGISPLMYAYEYKENEIVKMLLNHPKIDINKKTCEGRTALMYACSNSSKKDIEKLISKGANVNDKDMYKRTPLIYAARHGNNEIIQLLVDNGANINEKDELGLTAFSSAVSRIYKDIWGSHYETAKILYSNKADINTQDNGGTTPLMVALQQNDILFVNFLLDNNANAKLIDKSHKTTLMYAIDGGNKELIELILKKVDINFTKKSKTALIYACDKKAEAPIIQLLLDNGADVNIYVSNYAFGMLMYNKYIIYDKKYYPIFKIFIEKSNNIPSDFMEKSLNYLSGSCDFNRNYLEYLELFDLLKLAINKGVDVNTINRTKTNLLMIAAKSNNLEFAKFLIDKKINIDAKDFDGKTALSYSTSIEMNDLLIQNGAKVPSKSYYFNKVGLKTIFKKLLN